VERTRFLMAALALVAALALAAQPACGPRGQPLTAAEIDAYGQRVFPADTAKCFRAAVGALQSLGYEIAVADPDSGVIVTKPRLIRAYGGSGVATGEYRRYRVQLTPQPNGTRVRAIPGMLLGSNDVSGDRIWIFDGRGGERQLWQQLFAEMQALLPS
jgi:hypothetical protein